MIVPGVEVDAEPPVGGQLAHHRGEVRAERGRAAHREAHRPVDPLERTLEPARERVREIERHRRRPALERLADQRGHQLRGRRGRRPHELAGVRALLDHSREGLGRRRVVLGEHLLDQPLQHVRRARELRVDETRESEEYVLPYGQQLGGVRRQRDELIELPAVHSRVDRPAARELGVVERADRIGPAEVEPVRIEVRLELLPGTNRPLLGAPEGEQRRAD